MMANSSKDPYWQAGVRREILEHPESQGAIEAECSACHQIQPRGLGEESPYNGRFSVDFVTPPGQGPLFGPVQGSSEEVQVYEAIMGDTSGRVTTGLLQASRYLEDNRVLPAGFAKHAAPAFVAVHGDALTDPDFVGARDRVRYELRGEGPFTVEATLWYRPVGYRWAKNLESVPSAEAERFLRYFESLAHVSAALLARAEAVCGP
jgi:hypothetical protein